jgi:hypothetical protein
MLCEIMATQYPYSALHVLFADNTNYTGIDCEWFHLWLSRLDSGN